MLELYEHCNVSCLLPYLRWEEVVDLIKEMQELSVPRDEYTYCAAMNVSKTHGPFRKTCVRVYA